MFPARSISQLASQSHPSDPMNSGRTTGSLFPGHPLEQFNGQLLYVVVIDQVFQKFSQNAQLILVSATP